jgi:hypothetical protein
VQLDRALQSTKGSSFTALYTGCQLLCACSVAGWVRVARIVTRRIALQQKCSAGSSKDCSQFMTSSNVESGFRFRFRFFDPSLSSSCHSTALLQSNRCNKGAMILVGVNGLQSDRGALLQQRPARRALFHLCWAWQLEPGTSSNGCSCVACVVHSCFMPCCVGMLVSVGCICGVV